MPYYQLWRQSDNKTFDLINARDKEHAVAIFGQSLRTKLTLAEGPAAPEYMMGRIEKEVSWRPKPDIPVWETR